MAMSSLEFDEISLWELLNKNAKSAGIYDFGNDRWFERDFKKGPDYRPGPVTVINFDYLEKH